MAKAPDAFRTISEVADWLGVQTHVLRFWESKFAQVKPLKRAGGRRYYRPADMELLGGLRKLLHEDGLTIKGAQKFIRENGVKAVAALSPPVDGKAQADLATQTESPAQPVETLHEAPAPAAEEPVAQAGGEAAVDVTGEAPAPAAEPEPEGYFDAVDVTGEAPAPAAEPEPEGYFDAVPVGGEEPAPAAEVHIARDGVEQAVDVTGEAPAPAPGAAPERKSNFFVDDPAEEPPIAAESAPETAGDDGPSLPSFIREPMDKGRETTIPPLTPGPPPLPESEAGDARFAGVGAAAMPDEDGPAPGAEAAAPPEAVAPVPMPQPTDLALTPAGLPDPAALRPLYDRLVALRARMG